MFAGQKIGTQKQYNLQFIDLKVVRVKASEKFLVTIGFVLLFFYIDRQRNIQQCIQRINCRNLPLLSSDHQCYCFDQVFDDTKTTLINICPSRLQAISHS